MGREKEKEKEKDRVGLRPVDEGEGVPKVLRLHKGAVEEVVKVKVQVRREEGGVDVRLEAVGRDGASRRSNEPGIESLLEMEMAEQGMGWEYATRDEGGDGVRKSWRLPWGWVVVLGCLFVWGIVWSLTQVGEAGKRREGLAVKSEGVAKVEEMEEAEAMQVLDSIEKAVESFTGSKTIDEMLKYSRHPERVRPLMVKYYGGREVVPILEHGTMKYDALMMAERGNIWRVVFDLKTGEEKQLLVEVMSPEVVKVDWETYVCDQPMDWDEFVNQRGAGGQRGDFRVRVVADNFFSYEFSDAEVFDCFRLTTGASYEVLYGYVLKGSVLSGEISKVIKEGGSVSTPMILRLAVPKDAKSKRGVMIEKILTKGWIYLESPGVGE